MNVNIDGEIKEDINLDNLGKNFISEENDTKVLSSSARGGEKKKLKSFFINGRPLSLHRRRNLRRHRQKRIPLHRMNNSQPLV